jgi:hypothetical protein
MTYEPTPGLLPGEQYKPSNSDEGYGFIAEFCQQCARDKSCREGCDIDDCDDNEKCEILGASFRGEAVEWRELEGNEVTCIAFVPAGEPIPAPRCPHTADLFSASNES